LVRPVLMAASMALATLRNLSSCGNLSVSSPSLSVKDCLFFFLGGASVIIARFYSARGWELEQELPDLLGSVCIFFTSLPTTAAVVSSLRTVTCVIRQKETSLRPNAQAIRSLCHSECADTT
jgi:hypothetical protein